MKATAKQYARSLFEATAEADKKELPEIIGRFIETLKQHNALSRIDDVLREFGRLWDEAHGTVQAEVVTAQPLDAETEKAIAAYAREMTGADQVELKHRLAPEVLAGFVLRAGDRVYDASAATKLKRLKQEIVG